MPPLSLPPLPAGMYSQELDFDNLIEVLVTDDAYYGIGEYTEAELEDKFSSPGAT